MAYPLTAILLVLTLPCAPEARICHPQMPLVQLQASAATTTPVHVVARDFAFEMPETIHGGVVTLRFENRGREPHYMRFMRLASGKTADDVLAWRRSRTPAPPWLTPAGGIGTIAPDISTDYTTRIEPGRYVALCGHPSPDGTPHAEKGMVREFVVGPTLGENTPTRTRTLELREHAFTFDPPSLKGTVTWHVVNRGSLMHQALLVRLPAGVSADAELAWFRGGSRGPRPGQPVGGVIELGPQGEAWFTVALEPGRYMLLCSVAASASDRHFDRGMVRHFIVR